MGAGLRPPHPYLVAVPPATAPAASPTPPRTNGQRIHAGDVDEGACGGQGVGAAAANGDDAVVRLQHVPIASDLQAGVAVCHHQCRLARGGRRRRRRKVATGRGGGGAGAGRAVCRLRQARQPRRRGAHVEAAEVLVEAPHLAELHAAARQLPRVLLQLGLQALKQRERVRRRACGRRGGARRRRGAALGAARAGHCGRCLGPCPARAPGQRTRKAADAVLPDLACLAHVGLHHRAPHGHLAVGHQHHLQRPASRRRRERRRRQQPVVLRWRPPPLARATAHGGDLSIEPSRPQTVRALAWPSLRTHSTVVECTSLSLLLLCADRLLGSLGSRSARLAEAAQPGCRRRAPRERAAWRDSMVDRASEEGERLVLLEGSDPPPAWSPAAAGRGRYSILYFSAACSLQHRCDEILHPICGPWIRAWIRSVAHGLTRAGGRAAEAAGGLPPGLPHSRDAPLVLNFDPGPIIWQEGQPPVTRAVKGL